MFLEKTDDTKTLTEELVIMPPLVKDELPCPPSLDLGNLSFNKLFSCGSGLLVSFIYCSVILEENELAHT